LGCAFSSLLLGSLFECLTGESFFLKSKASFAICAVGVLSWMGALAMAYWTLPSYLFFSSIRSCAIFGATAFFVLWSLWTMGGVRLLERFYPIRISKIVRILIHCCAVILFGVLSYRTNVLFKTSVLHHWSFWIGPIESVREGGWLLWDVPSQYGFLSILCPALFPVKNSWEALYLFQGTLLWIVALLMYFRFCGKSGGIFRCIFACIATMTTVYFFAGGIRYLEPPSAYPSVGPMRFFWCHISLFALWICLDKEKPRTKLYLWIGGAICVIGSLWSLESAIYSLSIYGAAVGVLALQSASISSRTAGMTRAKGEKAAWPIVAFARELIEWILPPVGLFAGAICGVTLFYIFRLGHGPDWMSFFEYPLKYAGGFGAMPIRSDGPVWALVAVFGLTLGFGLTLFERDWRNPNLAIVAGVWGVLWTTASYFISRSHANNVCNLMHINIAALAVLLPLTERINAGVWRAMFKQLLAPLIIVGLAIVLLSENMYRGLPGSRENWAHVERRLPAMDNGWGRFLVEHNVDPSVPFVCNYRNKSLTPQWFPNSKHEPTRLNSVSWLPKPMVMLNLLGHDRRMVYFQRFCARSRRGGWMLARKATDAVLIREIEKLYEMTPKGQLGEYTLYWCEFRVE
jgi:hypothetical protein